MLKILNCNCITYSDSTESLLLKSKKSTNHFIKTCLKNSSVTSNQTNSTKQRKLSNVTGSNQVSFKADSNKKCPLAEIEQRIKSIFESRGLSTKKKSETKNSTIKNPLQQICKTTDSLIEGT